MSNVVQLNVSSRIASEANRQSALICSFAQHRRFGDDVFWLKENAELLNVLECSGANLSESALAIHEKLYAGIEKRIGFFPQYYRFLLSICLDLEDLGLGGGKGEKIVDWVARQGMAEAELSDLQRGEARRLMLRRGRDPLPDDRGLEDRLRSFISRSATFAMPNKKAAYELTHTIFYLSEYGRKDPRIDENARRSLDFAGTLAFLDQNADLLAEICVAMRFSGVAPPAIWENWLTRHSHLFSVETGEAAQVHDDYHEYLVCNWFAAVIGERSFGQPLVEERMSFHRPDTGQAPLRAMSECMFRLDDARCDDWQTMRSTVTETLSDDGHAILTLAEQASHSFDAFFAGFSRTGMAGGGL
ncbi:hypothetical protein U5922_005890 [Aquicoccus sp. G2-2]|uniref:DUF6902 family protein n=1 Tax=Aquicoccus sp. G2-2 TaxID=3092120 RepID=UPI002AE056D1|nr:hypothetical protein [Aquicoccus sp. G2-2]MEA1113023.1 hypothetical protein [Aquicoccus sp. G2-2]